MNNGTDDSERTPPAAGSGSGVPASGDQPERDPAPGAGPGVGEESRETGVRNRSPLTWLVGAAALLAVVAVAYFAVTRGGGENEPGAPVDGATSAVEGQSSTDPSGAGGESTTPLQAPPAAAFSARCMVPTADLIGQQDVAFDGTLVNVSDSIATLEVSRWFAGKETGLVEVKAIDEGLRSLIDAVEFKEGGRYLVSATDGRVTVCGMSGPFSPELEQLYEQAFGG